MVSKVIGFLKDDDFIDYVLGVTPELVSHWETYFRVHPDEKADAEEAKAILLAPEDVECGFSADECQALKDNIISSIQSFQGTL